MDQPRPPREPRPIPTGSPANVHQAELAKGRTHLDVIRTHHLDLSKRFLGEEFYETDLLFMAAMARSYSLVDGFISAFDTWNPIVAAPLLRLQLDSLVRVAYLTKVPNVAEVAWHIINGGEFRTLTDAEGKKLLDARLIEHAQQSHPWVDDVYKATSGWVHFSPAHLKAVVQVTPDESNDDIFKLFGSVPIRPAQISLATLEGLLGAMIKATSELFGYVEIWDDTKKAKLAAAAQT